MTLKWPGNDENVQSFSCTFQRVNLIVAKSLPQEQIRATRKGMTCLVNYSFISVWCSKWFKVYQVANDSLCKLFNTSAAFLKVSKVFQYLPNSKDMSKHKGISRITSFSEPVTNLKDLYENMGHQGDDLIYKWVT